jgi:hypothetical protein
MRLSPMTFFALVLNSPMVRRIRDLEQRPGCLVHTDVGRLRRQHDGDQQRVRVDVFQLAARVGVALLEPPEEFLDVGLFHGREISVGPPSRQAVCARFGETTPCTGVFRGFRERIAALRQGISTAGWTADAQGNSLDPWRQERIGAVHLARATAACFSMQ